MTQQKKLLLLGGLRYLLPVIEAAHKLGIYVITCDYLPNNIAHKYSDEYHNVSIIDKEAVLQLAKELNVDGIMSFAVDPGVITAAYVADKLDLPSAGPYESICILQNKDRFREFLQKNGFNCPWSYSYSNANETLKNVNNYTYPCIVKPTDSAGSKGVTRIDNEKELLDAVNIAFDHSISHKIIIEEFIEKKGFSSDTDSFSIDGRLEFVSYSSQRFDENAAGPYVPAAYSWPSSMSMQEESYLTSELQRLLTLLNMRTSIYNIETRIGTNGKPYIMEVSPRGGGNRLAEMLRYATGQDLILNAVRAAVGYSIDELTQPIYKGHWAEVVLHSEQDGSFKGLEIAESIKSNVVEQDLWVSYGDKVRAFNGANDAIGTLVLKFNTQVELETALNTQSNWIEVVVE